MVCFKCDRCGIVEENENHPFATLDITTNDVPIVYYELCEQCYTTIMEVLKDGEIK